VPNSDALDKLSIVVSPFWYVSGVFLGGRLEDDALRKMRTTLVWEAEGYGLMGMREGVQDPEFSSYGHIQS
jgi:hypothetical protein